MNEDALAKALMGEFRKVLERELGVDKLRAELNVVRRERDALQRRLDVGLEKLRELGAPELNRFRAMLDESQKEVTCLRNTNAQLSAELDKLRSSSQPDDPPR